MADSASTSHQWTEANIVPSTDAPLDTLRLILEVIDPLMHESLSGQWDAWHYFWESEPINQLHVRLRILWAEGTQAEGRAKLGVYLDQARDDRKLTRWFEGNHGQEDQTYQGEASGYGLEMWELVYKDWTSGCEMALAILRYQTNDSLTKPLDWHWSRRVHLFTNPLDPSFWVEGFLCLYQACGYLELAAKNGDPRISKDAVKKLIKIRGKIEDNLRRLVEADKPSQ